MRERARDRERERGARTRGERERKKRQLVNRVRFCFFFPHHEYGPGAGGPPAIVSAAGPDQAQDQAQQAEMYTRLVPCFDSMGRLRIQLFHTELFHTISVTRDGGDVVGRRLRRRRQR